MVPTSFLIARRTNVDEHHAHRQHILNSVTNRAVTAARAKPYES